MYTSCQQLAYHQQTSAYLLLGVRGPEDREGSLVALVAPLEHGDQVRVEVVVHLLTVHLGKDGWLHVNKGS